MAASPSAGTPTWPAEPAFWVWSSSIARKNHERARMARSWFLHCLGCISTDDSLLPQPLTPPCIHSQDPPKDLIRVLTQCWRQRRLRQGRAVDVKRRTDQVHRLALGVAHADLDAALRCDRLGK